MHPCKGKRLHLHRHAAEVKVTPFKTRASAAWSGKSLLSASKETGKEAFSLFQEKLKE